MQKYLYRSILCLGCALSTVSIAQGSGSGLSLEEITVTAQRRAEGLGDVPLSISATSGETMEKFNIARFDDLQKVIPNLHINEGVAAPTVTIRGLGSGAANFGFEQAVGMFVDGVFIGRSRLLASPMFDVERVEVVRGPQGALFGKNTVAGALSITTAKPTDEFEAKVRTGYEFEYGGHLVEGVISGPLSETVSGRIAAVTQHSGGYMDNLATGDEDGDRDTWLVRGSLAFEPSDTFNAALTVEASEVSVDGSLFQTHVAGPLAALPAPNEFNRDFVRYSESSSDEFDDTESSGVTLTMNWDIGEHTLTSITSYRELESDKFIDLAATLPTFTTNSIAENFDQTYQEFRVLSPSDSAFNYSFGALYLENDLQTRQVFTLRPRILGVPGVAPFDAMTDRNFSQQAESWSVYFSGTYNVSEALRLTAGIRYTDEEKDGRAFHMATEQNPLSPPPERPGTWIPYDVSDTRSETKATPSFNVQYDITDEVMLYGSYAIGHKGGGFVSNESSLGFQLANAAPGENPFQYEDEEADSIEIGFKARLFDGRATLNAAIFQTDFENLQVSTFNGSGFDTDNAAEVRSQGFEFDGRALLTENLTLAFSGAYLDSEYTEYLDAFACNPRTAADPDCQPGGDGQVDLTGETLIKAPESEFTVSLDWSSAFGDNYEFGASIMAAYKDGFYNQPDLDLADFQESTTKVSGRLSVSDQDGKWSVALIGRNLTDEDTLSWSFDTPFAPGAHSGVLEPPRTVSVEGSYRF